MSLGDRLKRAGIAEEHARAHAEAMDEALREAVATKHDISNVRNDLERARSDLERARSDLEHKIELAVRDMTIRTGGMLIALFAALTAIKFFD